MANKKTASEELLVVVEDHDHDSSDVEDLLNGWQFAEIWWRSLNFELEFVSFLNRDLELFKQLVVVLFVARADEDDFPLKSCVRRCLRLGKAHDDLRATSKPKFCCAGK